MRSNAKERKTDREGKGPHTTPNHQSAKADSVHTTTVWHTTPVLCYSIFSTLRNGLPPPCPVRSILPLGEEKRSINHLLVTLLSKWHSSFHTLSFTFSFSLYLSLFIPPNGAHLRLPAPVGGHLGLFFPLTVVLSFAASSSLLLPSPRPPQGLFVPGVAYLL